jgi:cell division protein FtsA
MVDYDGVHVGIDVGTSKTLVVIAQKDQFEDKLLILGIGSAPNSGVSKGKINNIENTIKAIKKASEDAMLMAGVEFFNVNINIPGELESKNSNGIVAISRKDREVTYSDIKRVIDQSKHIQMGADKKILHVFPQSFKLDEQDNIIDPLGMTGLRLEGNVHLINTNQINITNIVKCIQKAGFSPTQGLATPYASANAVLSEDDKSSGCLLVDIGAGSTSIMAFQNGFPVLTSVLLVGGHSITRDLSIGLRISEGMAENIKKKYGCVYSSLVDPIEEIEVAIYGKNQVERISKQRINSILEPRAEEIFMMVKKKIEENGYSLTDFANGCVLTGGCAKMNGMIELCEKVMGIHSRLGIPERVSGIVDEVHDPSFSVAIGLCFGEKNLFADSGITQKSNLGKGESSSLKSKFGNMMKDLFG